MPLCTFQIELLENFDRVKQNAFLFNFLLILWFFFFFFFLVYDILTGGIQCRLEGHKAVIRDCIWHPYENEIITTSVCTMISDFISFLFRINSFESYIIDAAAEEVLIHFLIISQFGKALLIVQWDGTVALWRFDERVRRNINPEFVVEGTGDEDTSDELYRQLQRKRKQKRKVR